MIRQGCVLFILLGILIGCQTKTVATVDEVKRQETVKKEPFPDWVKAPQTGAKEEGVRFYLGMSDWVAREIVAKDQAEFSVRLQAYRDLHGVKIQEEIAQTDSSEILQGDVSVSQSKNKRQISQKLHSAVNNFVLSTSFQHFYRTRQTRKTPDGHTEFKYWVRAGLTLSKLQAVQDPEAYKAQQEKQQAAREKLQREKQAIKAKELREEQVEEFKAAILGEIKDALSRHRPGGELVIEWMKPKCFFRLNPKTRTMVLEAFQDAIREMDDKDINPLDYDIKKSLRAVKKDRIFDYVESVPITRRKDLPDTSSFYVSVTPTADGMGVIFSAGWLFEDKNAPGRTINLYETVVVDVVIDAMADGKGNLVIASNNCGCAQTAAYRVRVNKRLWPLPHSDNLVIPLKTIKPNSCTGNWDLNIELLGPDSDTPILNIPLGVKNSTKPKRFFMDGHARNFPNQAKTISQRIHQIFSQVSNTTQAPERDCPHRYRINYSTGINASQLTLKFEVFDRKTGQRYRLDQGTRYLASPSAVHTALNSFFIQLQDELTSIFNTEVAR